MKNKYIKSPLNYVSGKYKLIDEIISLLPKNINTFVDLFGGGFNVGINVNATNIIYNDSQKQVVGLLCYLQHNKIEDILNKIDGYIEKYNLTNDNKEGYLALNFNSVAIYNENGSWTEEDEKDLLNILTVLDYNGIKFALSNNLKYNNPILDKWKDGYNIHYLNSNYSNCNYQKIDRSKDIEVLITNY